MRCTVHNFDGFLRRAFGIFEFAQDPDCLVRLRVRQIPHAISLPDGVIPAGEMILELHLWNEHLPIMPPQGPDLAWAARTCRLFIRSLNAVAQYMGEDSRCSLARAVGGKTALLPLTAYSGGTRFLKRLGFSLFPARNPIGRFGEFWDNLYGWALIWAFNSSSLRNKHLLRLRRLEMWMSCQRFLARFGKNSISNQPRETLAL